jgi:pimeloyl-ACP methyl ester carboxylesterase
VVIAGQGLDAVTRPRRPTSLYRRVLAALINGDELEPGSPEAETAGWIRGDPRAFLNVLDSLVPTPAGVLTRLTTPALVLIGDQDDGDADALAAVLPGAELAKVPGNHYTAQHSPELTTAILAFVGDHPAKT